MREKLKNLIHQLENSGISFNKYLLTIICVIFIRNFLETFADLGNSWTPISSLAYFIHFPLGYISAALLIILILQYFIKEQVEKISRIVLFFFPVILLAPTLDLFISGGKGYNMSYLFGDFLYLISRFTWFFGKYTGSGVTPGIHIEMIIIFLLLACYTYLKTGKILKTVLCIITLYIGVFIFASLPSLVTIFWNTLGFSMAPEGIMASNVIMNHFYTFNHKMSLLFFPLLIIELGVWLHLYDHEKFTYLLNKLKSLWVPQYLILFASGLLIGYKIIKQVQFFDTPFPLLILITSICTIILAWLWGESKRGNQYKGYIISTTSNHGKQNRSIAQGEYKKALSSLFLIMALIGACLVRYTFFIPITIFLALMYILYKSPLRLNSIPLLSSFCLALCSLSVSFAGFSLFSKDYSYIGFPPIFILLIVVFYTLVLNIKGFIDFSMGIYSEKPALINFLGEKTGRTVISLLPIVSFLIPTLILKSLLLLPFALVFGVLSIFLIRSKNVVDLPLFIIYTVFYCVILFVVYV